MCICSEVYGKTRQRAVRPVDVRQRRGQGRRGLLLLVVLKPGEEGEAVFGAHLTGPC
eukprot:COSAG02_NODE_64738_length_259_cov_1.743750_1_plen_56_part_01